ncbi:hypothetical protein UMM65_09940 [Aureibaculum sp. 2210JD6-5]|uniref:hypothetical protein n=1 Tax=Aureibaculum sp. 2210JD6-5 TaxID=3103957 RepID=UPI002AAD24A2|nr:hypothetical protein [Aureibaculum sp. 2210JD6-5]MDY7395563.1 hypothetical protein [Aureibaculum sp. 2210JD6-5]
MKKLKLIALSFALLFGSFAFASTIEPDTKSEIRKQIIDLLSKTEIDIDSNELVAKVSFMLNEKSELVIISVRSKNDSKSNSVVDNYIKKHLNYKKVKVKKLKAGKVYEMPFKIVK